MSGADEIRWAARVRQDKIRRLYALDATGIVDEELIDEVGYAIYARCESIRIATEAHAGRVTCPRCRAIIPRSWEQRDALLACECGWEVRWSEYHSSYQRKQLHGGGAFPAFTDFLERWPKARRPRDKLLLIDRVLHACHGSARFGATRPAAVNLIEGTMGEVIRLLDVLAYSDLSTPGTAESRATFDEAWKLRRWDKRL